ncbi:creatininase family protein [Acuticoccus sp. MNP-M23]|uniref:creatininase family protein n=1 Tax=Acuticoccus sp. MNP-M23 TaxID=3072793 RepID=UPI002814BC7B|nr:creatininase family protein [Acuticoccus sp. MNP-M23]WMS43499.1 creatininase family protein [Acuticoccus sp. MNP-M23]
MTTQKHRLAEMTFREFEARLPEKPVIIIPLGSQEEQGPSCPMGDYQLTEVIADRVAEQAGAVVAPIMPFGYADYFRTVPGGIALRPETFSAVLEDMIVNFLDHDLVKVVILNGHSGNAALIDMTVRRIKKERGILVPAIHLWRSVPDSVFNPLYGDDAPRAKGHGADPLTSVYKHLFPDMMRPDLEERPGEFGTMIGLPTAGLGAVKFKGVDVTMPVDVTDRCANGIAGGDPAVASADKGEAIVNYLVTFCADFVAHLEGADTRTHKGE